VSDTKTVSLSTAEELRDYLFFTVGAAQNACAAHGQNNERSRWAGKTLANMVPAFSALITVALAHPEEYAAALLWPVEVEPMP